MKDIIWITSASIKNNLRSRITVIVVLATLLICAVGLAATFSIVLIKPEMKALSPDQSRLEMSLSLILSVTSLLGLGINLNAFAFQILTREKAKGIIQSLLATPLKEKDIWLGKSLAIFLPGLIVGEMLTLTALVSLNYIFFVPRIGFLINPWIILSNFVAIPLMYLSLSLLVYLIGLIGKPATSNVIAIIFLSGIITVVINLVIRSILDATSWTYFLVNVGIAAIIGIITLLLLPRLEKERIVLSS